MAAQIELPADWGYLVATLTAPTGRRPVVLVDGGSGAGKTTLAKALRIAVEPEWGPTQLVSLDDVYPGWHGLAAASEAVWRTILRADNPGHPTWDWVAGEPSGWVAVDPRSPIIVEGCGALSPKSAALATSRLWYERTASERKSRALGRDGETYRPWWDVWSTQEEALWAVHRPWELADLIIHGDSPE